MSGRRRWCDFRRGIRIRDVRDGGGVLNGRRCVSFVEPVLGRPKPPPSGRGSCKIYIEPFWVATLLPQRVEFLEEGRGETGEPGIARRVGGRVGGKEQGSH